jgi:uncharacterized paraquat-inducible protein A
MISGQLANYKRELLSAPGARPSVAVECPRCGLVLTPRLPALEPRHCPRCMARSRAVVKLERATGGAPDAGVVA